MISINSLSLTLLQAIGNPIATEAIDRPPVRHLPKRVLTNHLSPEGQHIPR